MTDDAETERLLKRLRARLAPRPPALATGLRPAAVLVPLVARPAGLRILLTVRRADLPVHAGQICFPGGRVEAGETLAAAALREAREETGIDPCEVTPLGFLPACETGSGFAVAPLVGRVAPGFTPVPCAREVAEVFEMPLAALTAPGAFRREPVAGGRRPLYHVLRWRGRFIWGATATMLHALGGLLAAAEEGR